VLTDTGTTLSDELVQPADQTGEVSTRLDRCVSLRLPKMEQRCLPRKKTVDEANEGSVNNGRIAIKEGCFQ
jgi:hypothetical protein